MPDKTLKVLIIGDGGHAQVVADILLRSHEAGSAFLPIGYIGEKKGGKTTFLDLPVLGTLFDLTKLEHNAVIVAIGDNKVRRQIFLKLKEKKEKFTSAIHPKAILAPNVKVGIGTMICAGVVINTASVIGENVILNTGCTVDHHNRIGSHVHISPGANLAGGVTVGPGSLIGVGSSVLPQKKIGRWSVIGAGSVVTKDISSRSIVAGIPAKIIERSNHVVSPKKIVLS